MAYPSSTTIPAGTLLPGEAASTTLLVSQPAAPLGATWEFELCDRLGGFLADLSIVAKVRRVLNDTATVSFDLDHEDDAAYALFGELANGLPQIKCWRDGTLWARGWWQPQQEESNVSQSTISCVFRGPFAEIDNTHLSAHYGTYNFTTGELAPYTRDQGIVAFELATGRNAPNLNFNAVAPASGLMPGNHTASVTRDRAYWIYKSSGEAIRQLTEVSGGLEFIERPVPENTVIESGASNIILARLDVAGTNGFGTNKASTVIFEYGTGASNCVSAARHLGRPVNHITAIGRQPEDPTAQRPVWVHYDSVSITKWGRQEAILDLPDVSVPDTLTEHALGALRSNPTQSITFQPSVAGDLQPGRDYWLGDTVRFVADYASLQVDVTARVMAIEIETNTEGDETAHRVEIGEQRARWPVGMVRDIERRLTALTRHSA